MCPLQCRRGNTRECAHAHTHFINYMVIIYRLLSTRQAVGLRGKYLSYPRLSSEEADLKELSNLPKILDLREFRSGIQTGRPGSRAHTFNCDTTLPSRGPQPPMNWTDSWDRTGQNNLGSTPAKQVMVYLHGSGSCQWHALCLAKEQMFNNFAVARRRLHNMAELFLNFGKCWLLFSKCLL